MRSSGMRSGSYSMWRRPAPASTWTASTPRTSARLSRSRAAHWSHSASGGRLRGSSALVGTVVPVADVLETDTQEHADVFVVELVVDVLAIAPSAYETELAQVAQVLRDAGLGDADHLGD